MPTSHLNHAPDLNAAALATQLQDLLQAARRSGADAAEAQLSRARALDISVRNQQVDGLEYAADQAAQISVYCKQRNGSASTTDLSAEGLQAALAQAMTIARFTEPDQYAGLADAELMARDWPELSL
ncbi:MAG TPA: DNA gyrase modulator, partial [Salinisphaeraceae bacterium]|nr:DNA gyrase modulator [Salinisphaeraceae bacterium]